MVSGCVIGHSRGNLRGPQAVFLTTLLGSIPCFLSTKSKRGTPTLTCFGIWRPCPCPSESMLLTWTPHPWVLQLLLTITPTSGCWGCLQQGGTAHHLISSHPCAFQQKKLRLEKERNLLKITQKAGGKARRQDSWLML